MKYCKRCLYPANHPLNITFDDRGVCSGCRIHEEKDVLDWDRRGGTLKKILDGYRDRSGKSYDCIIPVSGARDSYFIVHTIKNVYKMHPLVVTYNKQYNTKTGIRNMAYLKTLFGVDCLALTVKPQTVQKITRATIRLFGSIYWHCLAGATVYPVQTAVRFKIPLIIWGAHQGIDQVGMFSHSDEVEMTRKYRKEHDLMGYEAEDLIDAREDINEDDLRNFYYPHDKELEKVGVRGIYLNNYIRWDSKKQHELMIKLYNYETSAQLRTFDTYNDVDCFHYSDLHDYIKFLKWGYGKATDHACREIRLKRMTREEGIAHIRQRQDIPPDRGNLNNFLSWVDMDEGEFWSSVDKRRDLRIWEKDGSKQWHLKDSAINHIDDQGVDENRLEKTENCEFIITPSRNPKDKEDKYVLIGRGHVDPVDWKAVKKDGPLPPDKEYLSA